MFRFFPSSIYILLSTFLVVFPVSSSIVAEAFTSSPFSSTQLVNFFNKFAPQSKYNIELFFIFSSSILLNVKSTSEYSFVLSLVPESAIVELSNVTTFVL